MQTFLLSSLHPHLRLSRSTSARPKPSALWSPWTCWGAQPLTVPTSLHPGSCTAKTHFSPFSKAAFFRLNKGKRGAAVHWLSLTKQCIHTCFTKFSTGLSYDKRLAKAGWLACHWPPLLRGLQHKCNKTSQWVHQIHKVIHGSPTLSSFTIYKHHLRKK